MAGLLKFTVEEDMKGLRVIALVSLLCVQPGISQTSTPAASSLTKDPTAVALAQKTLAAMGLPQSYQDSVADGTLTMSDSQKTLSVRLKSKNLTEYRHDITATEGTFSYVLNGLDACILRADGSKVQGAFQNSRGRGAEHIPALSLLARYQDSNVQVQYAGTFTVNGKPADVIAVSYSPPGDPDRQLSYAVSQRLYFIDRDAGLVAKVQFNQYGENNPDPQEPVETEIYFSDYRSVSGLMVPFRQVTYLDGTEHSTLVLTSVAINTGLADADFALTCGAPNGQ